MRNRRIQDTRNRMAQRGGQDRVCVFLVLGVESSSNYALRTESYDNMDPVGVDPRWDVFGPFHDYLLKSFPLAYVIHATRPDHVFTRFAATPPCL